MKTNGPNANPSWISPTSAGLPSVGADGNVLTSDGTNWASEPPLGGVGGELVSIQTFPTLNGGNTITSATWTRPSGVKRIEVHIVGAGGWGQGNTSLSLTSGGGGAGGYCVGVYDVTNLSTATVIVGASNDAAGIKNSSFAGTGITTMNAGGGGDQNENQTGGTAGTATGGMLNFVGEAGKPSNNITTSGGPHGGESSFGGVWGNGVDGVISNRIYGQHGYCYIKEYSDASAYLVGEKLVSHQLFVGSGTWTKPAGISKIRVIVQGGGGSSTHDNEVPAHGGGGGGCAVAIQDVTNVTSIDYVATSAPNATTWGTGGTQVSAGAGGAGTTNAGGGGGNGSGGDVNVGGSNGDTGGAAAGWFSSRGKGATAAQANQSHSGLGGCIYVEEYSDPSLVSGGSLVPTGVVNPYAGATAPAGWLLCFGQSISRTTYSTLFTAIGTTYGSASGTTFNLPDMRGRVVAGQDDMGGTAASRVTTAGGGLDGVTLGAAGGSQTHTTGWHGNATPPADEAVVTSLGNLPPTIILNYIIKT